MVALLASSARAEFTVGPLRFGMSRAQVQAKSPCSCTRWPGSDGKQGLCMPGRFTCEALPVEGGPRRVYLNFDPADHLVRIEVVLAEGNGDALNRGLDALWRWLQHAAGGATLTRECAADLFTAAMGRHGIANVDVAGKKPPRDAALAGVLRGRLDHGKPVDVVSLVAKPRMARAPLVPPPDTDGAELPPSCR